MTYDQILNICKVIFIIIGTLSGSLMMIITVLYFPSFLQKKVKLKEAENIAQENLEIVERATFFETNQEFQKIINDQLEDIRANAAKLKSIHAESEQIQKDILNSKGKK